MRLVTFAFFLLLSNASILAQQLQTLIITEPQELQGQFDIIQGLFSTVDFDTLTGYGVIFEDGIDDTFDGCSESTNDISDKIAFIDRGTCTFVDKAMHARNGNAAAAIICNGENTAEIFPMSGEPEMDYPAAMISHDDCIEIKSLLQQGIEIGISFNLTLTSEDYLSQSEHITFFPNPTANFLSNQAEEPFEYQLFNQSGKLLLSGKSEVGKPIDLRTLNAGFYFIQTKEREVYKIVKY